MPEHKDIYSNQAHAYDQLVDREDYQQNILPALNHIRRLEGLDVLETGAGTGRLTRMISSLARSMWVFDASPAMLKVANTRLLPRDLHNIHLAVADHRNLPVLGRSTDLVISGWSVCYVYEWNKDNWREELQKTLIEFQRVLRLGGTIILLETFGTGFEFPVRLKNMELYFEFLEEQGFYSSWIRTDYRFETWQEGEKICRFFFGDELADRIRREKLPILPECTGIWWKEY